MAGFAPLSRREQALGPSGPYEGVPSFLQHTLWGWTSSRLTDRNGIKAGLLTLLELQLRLVLPGDGAGPRFRSLEQICKSNDEVFLDVVDFLAQTLENQYDDEKGYAGDLDNFLGLAGSVWQVVPFDISFRLRRRLDQSVEDALAIVLGPEDRASQHLGQALNYSYGRNPDASAAYREAVRAVEAVGKPVVTPANDKATLGSMIAAMNEKPAKWAVVLTPNKGDPVRYVISMMELLWTSQLDRHGTDDETVPLSVTMAQAQSAVHVAASLVQLFRSQAISHR